MRQGLEISDIEASTKIRAKYLRAIENEEFDLLPGPTFVKSFLRTYAEALDLDSRLLLEEYKSRYERFDEHEVRPPQRGTSHSSSGRERRPPRRSHPGRWILLACAAAVIVVVISLLSSGDDTPERKGVTSPVSTTASTRTTAGKTDAKTSKDQPAKTTKSDTAAAGKTVKLKIVPTGEVYACLFAGKKPVIAGQTLQAGGTPETYRSRHFIVVLGNGNATLDVDGKTVKVPQSQDAIGYDVTSAGRKRLSAADLPTC